MQIFRPFESHEQSALYLDNRRLSKQVLELYQIIRVCLAELGIIEGNTRYLSHPIVKHIYNDGHPYLADALHFLHACDIEHQRRGGNRNDAFRNDLVRLTDMIHNNYSKFNNNKIPPFYVYGDMKVYGEEVYALYRSLLYDKWLNDTIAPRCGVKLPAQ
ncbi:pyrimidine dimer DNA glycosylase/endonuclease V [Macrococcus equipercicus]|uniref:Pyrimidine dimer DNA glycosylase n=1 Tax=Macrococcus equipercicus TaxID=69967 RepID=A0A9Q9BVV1_9STAP|nr:pyrimidine dimer DNA glycosylase/endonuclease V [Macrococcus equipercicus]UTH13928.1 hypothetical protein KFV11_00715 [Macrococcus equipercicus]